MLDTQPRVTMHSESSDKSALLSFAFNFTLVETAESSGVEALGVRYNRLSRLWWQGSGTSPAMKLGSWIESRGEYVGVLKLRRIKPGLINP